MLVEFVGTPLEISLTVLIVGTSIQIALPRSLVILEAYVGLLLKFVTVKMLETSILTEVKATVILEEYAVQVPVNH